jgi:hypothetical protein
MLILLYICIYSKPFIKFARMILNDTSMKAICFDQLYIWINENNFKA